MKDTGVTRRIDELGRIVIPKELRRAYRIKEGDTLEIFTEGDALIMKKSAEIMSFYELSLSFIRPIGDIFERTVLVCDTDKVISARGDRAKEFVGKNLSDEIIEVLKGRKNLLEKRDEEMIIVEGAEAERVLVCPINRLGDGIGLFIVLVAEFEHKRDELVAVMRYASALFAELIQ